MPPTWAPFGEQGLTLPVLIELGPAGGRTGVRDDAQFQAVADEIARWPALAWPASKSTRRAAGRTGHPRLPAPRHRRARPGRSGPPAQERPGTDLRRRLGLVRRGGRGILESGHRRAAGRGAAPRLLPVARRGRLPLGGRAHQRAQPRGPQDGSGPAARAAGLGLRAIAARAGPRHHRAGQARRRLDAGLPTPALRYRPGQAAPAPPRRTGS